MGQAHIYPRGCVFSTLKDIEGKKVTVMGLGLNGGGLETVRFLLKQGALVTATDLKSGKELEPTIKSLRDDRTINFNHLHLVLGHHDIEDFKSADVVVKNPIVRYETSEYLQAARCVETDISMFLHFCPSPIIAVTGSKGKSTVASLIHYGLRGAGFDAYIGGNIAVNPLSFLDELDGLTPVILELSSWQLRDLRGRGCLKPYIAVMTRITRDHQNWYTSMEEYIADKELIFSGQTEEDYAIIPRGSDTAGSDGVIEGVPDWGEYFVSRTRAHVLRYSLSLLPHTEVGAYMVGDKGVMRSPEWLLGARGIGNGVKQDTVIKTLLVPGEHNKANALAAATAMSVMKVASAQTAELLSEWKGIPHRLELCHKWVCHTHRGTKCNVLFYNDSASTVPEAASAAISAFGKPVIAICGGTDKNLDFTVLARAISGIGSYRAIAPEAVYLLSGTGTDKLVRILDANNVRYRGPYESLKELILVLRGDMLNGIGKVPESTQYVVFTPGTASFGAFKNEFDRGDRFKDLVRAAFGTV